MGKSDKKIKVSDAAKLMEAARSMEHLQAMARNEGDRWIAGVAEEMLGVWDTMRVVLRGDPDFVAALLDTPGDVEIEPTWLERLPYDAVAVTLVEPLRLFDGQSWCHYTGFIACGTRSRPDPTRTITTMKDRSGESLGDVSPARTFYGPFGASERGIPYMWRKLPGGKRDVRQWLPWPCAQGVRVLWLFERDDNGQVGAQTISALVRNQDDQALDENMTLDHLVAGVMAFLRTRPEDEGRGEGDEVSTLVRVALGILMYLSSVEPDLDEMPAAAISRPQQLKGAVVTNLGWRVGAALRSFRDEGSPGSGEGPRGWRVSPHVRAAHWTRVRVATRDASGKIVGDRLGTQGEDWSYELRWIPPVFVNVGVEGPQPVVRDVEAEAAG